jgi:transposase
MPFGNDNCNNSKAGPKIDPQAVEMAKIQSENERLRERLRQAELIIDVQKKVAQILKGSIEETQQDGQR